MTLEKPNYVLVDFENTQSIDTEKLIGLPIKIVIFVGQAQKSLPIQLVKRLLDHQGGVDIYESAGAGKNALDFQLAFYAGRIFEREPEAFIHIVSADKGFDPLVAHIRSQNRSCSRAETFAALPFFREGALKPASEKDDYTTFALPRRIEFAVARLMKSPANSRPRKVKTLMSALHSHFQKQLPLTDMEPIVKKLVSGGYVTIDASQGLTYNAKKLDPSVPVK